MKIAGWLLQVVLFFFVLAQTGCGPDVVIEVPPVTNDCNELSVYALYAARKISISPLTEFARPSGVQGPTQIKVYVSLLDSFGYQVKSPGIFRFELYEYVQRSAEPKGKRIIIWPDIDLTQPAENNHYWRDFLRSYEFALEYSPQSNQTYILQVTCLCPDGRRLSSESALKSQ